MNDILSPESYTYLLNLIIEYSPKILLGLIFLFVGNRAIKRAINILEKFLNNKKIDAIITTGGTGLTGRDITPEALDEIADKHIPGFGEMFRYISIKSVGTSSIQSRACAVLSNGKYVFALPGSSGGVTDAWDGILKHQLDINHKPCNFVELFPRLKEK